MLIEAIRRPLRYRWPGGEIRLVPGQPMDLPEDQARRVLLKAGDKVRVVEREDLVIEPALRPDGRPIRPVYWRGMDGRVHGPCSVSDMAMEGPPGRERFWLCVEEHGLSVWIRDVLLISQQTAEAARAVS